MASAVRAIDPADGFLMLSNLTAWWDRKLEDEWTSSISRMD